MLQWHAHSGGIWSLCFSPDGQFLLSGGEDGNLCLWEAQTGKRVHCFTGNDRSYSRGAFRSDGEMLARGHGRQVTLYAFPSLEQVRRIQLRPEVNSRRVQSIAFSPDATELAIGANSEITVRSLTRRRLRLNMGGNNTLYLCWSNDGAWLYASADYGPIMIWDAQTGEILHQLQHELAGDDEDGDSDARRIDVHGIALSPDRQFMVGAYDGGRVMLWEVAGQRVLRTWNEHTHNVLQVAYNPSGERFASASRDGMIHVYDPHASQSQTCFDWGIGSMHRVVYSPDGLTLAAAGERGEIVVWDGE
jgi:WD40 repeat protein